ncbi:SDR family NAD(P)-dependent oxidoreductase [Apibacter sp. HY039]|uniref:SDR family NAD(P)-dependent oxidoreductase n=1 Tax=Apibacter sp. HY039 TaxID=2501476 RepID=UPI000FEBCBB4|nr:SDR family NAD(P)-dependent oxidoreductase [Apibacter sp. HY039]
MPRTIVITGTSSGVGLALGNYFQEKGYRVFGLSRSVSDSAKFKTIPTDITKKEEIETAFATIIKETDTIDWIINNAGKGMVGPVENATIEEIIELFSLNLGAPAVIISHVLPIMRKTNQGKIINISSIGSVMGLPFRGFYSASKSSLDMVTESLRYELKNTHIEACTINLGDIKTNIADHRIRSEISDFYKSDFEEVYDRMNVDVNTGLDPYTLAPYIEKLCLQKKRLKPHYYFGTSTQKLSVWVKSLIPQKWFEKIIAKYSGL